MADKIVSLSEESIQVLRELIEREKRQKINTVNRPAVETPIPQAPDTYLFLTPAGGIPARSGTTPGQATCVIYRVLPGPILTSAAFTKSVYNFQPFVIEAGSWGIVTRDKWGAWCVIDSDSSHLTAPFPARISEAESALPGTGGIEYSYGFVEIEPIADGEWQDKVGGRTGTLTSTPAFEINESDEVPIDTRVWMFPGKMDSESVVDYRFEYDLGREFFPARISGSNDAAYGFVEVEAIADGEWQDKAGGRTGSSTVGSAWEANGETGIADGTIVFVTRGHTYTPSIVITETQAGDSATLREIQSIAISGASSGTFSLSYSGETTSSISFGVVASAIDTALEALPNLTSVSVTGTGEPDDPYLVTFLDGFNNLALMTSSGAVGLVKENDYRFEYANSGGGSLTIREHTPYANTFTGITKLSFENVLVNLSNPTASDGQIDFVRASYQAAGVVSDGTQHLGGGQKTVEYLGLSTGSSGTTDVVVESRKVTTAVSKGILSHGGTMTTAAQTPSTWAHHSLRGLFFNDTPSLTPSRGYFGAMGVNSGGTLTNEALANGTQRLYLNPGVFIFAQGQILVKDYDDDAGAGEITYTGGALTYPWQFQIIAGTETGWHFHGYGTKGGGSDACTIDLSCAYGSHNGLRLDSSGKQSYFTDRSMSVDTADSKLSWSENNPLIVRSKNNNQPSLQVTQDGGGGTTTMVTSVGVEFTSLGSTPVNGAGLHLAGSMLWHNLQPASFPAIPGVDGTYTLQLAVVSGAPTFSWV